MKRLLIPLIAALALPIAVNANWFGNKTFSISCDIKERKHVIDGAVLFGGWQKSNSGHFGLFKLNEKDKTASLSLVKKEDVKYFDIDVVSFNESSIKLTQKTESDGKYYLRTYTINRINGEFTFRHDSLPKDNIYSLYRGSCKKSDKKLF